MAEDEKTYDPREDTDGFSYLKVIQPILDDNCIKCHTNVQKAYQQTKADAVGELTEIFPLGTDWKYKISTTALSESQFAPENASESGWSTGKAGFGTAGDARDPSVCNSPSVSWLNRYAYFRKTFTLTEAQAEGTPSPFSGSMMRIPPFISTA